MQSPRAGIGRRYSGLRGLVAIGVLRDFGLTTHWRDSSGPLAEMDCYNTLAWSNYILLTFFRK
ncbi:MAG: hypothetical protein ACK5O8_05225 [Pirellula sp.]